MPLRWIWRCWSIASWLEVGGPAAIGAEPAAAADAAQSDADDKPKDDTGKPSIADWLAERDRPWMTPELEALAATFSSTSGSTLA